MLRSIIVTLLITEAAAITHHHHHHHQYRPREGTAPWHDKYVAKKVKTLSNKPYKHYTVPAWGFENDLIPKNNKSPWTYPTSLTQARSDPICASSGCDQYKHPEAPAGPPMDYPVPSFGPDPDIEATASNIDMAEKMYKHKIIMGTDASKAQWHNVAKDVDYNFDPELDQDIVASQRNLAKVETDMGIPFGVPYEWDQ